MSTATPTGTPSPGLHAADGHDLIRVHGARVNNLKYLSVEIPKRRLTSTSRLTSAADRRPSVSDVARLAEKESAC